MIITNGSTFVNNALTQIGGSVLINEDLSNLVEVGQNISDVLGVDNYVRALSNVIKVNYFDNFKYTPYAPNILIGLPEFGAYLRRIRVEIPDAEEDVSWSLEDGDVVNQDTVRIPDASERFFSGEITFQFSVTIQREQVMESFKNGEELNAFIAYIFEQYDTAIRMAYDNYSMATIRAMVMSVAKAAYGDTAFNAGTSIKCPNLLYEYNQANGTALTFDEAIKSKEFMQWAAFRMKDYKTMLNAPSKLFNKSGKLSTTPISEQRWCMLSRFDSAAENFSYSNTYHDAFVALPNASTVPFWQGPGEDYSSTNISTMKGKTPQNDDVTLPGVVAVMWDPRAIAMANVRSYTETHKNAAGSFVNYFMHNKLRTINDYDFNCVPFIMA